MQKSDVNMNSNIHHQRPNYLHLIFVYLYAFATRQQLTIFLIDKVDT